MTDASREEFYRSLPTKRMASGCVLRNPNGEVLIVKPTYKEYWDFPGGVVEENESLWDACRREMREELDFELDSGTLLCVDYCSSVSGYVESLMILFDCGVLDENVVDRFNIDPVEIEQARWFPVEEAAGLLGGRISRRLLAVEPWLGSGSAVYLEDQVPI